MVEQDHPLDDVLLALADPTRRALLHELRTGERTIGELAAPLSMTFAAVSKHVQVLERAGLVNKRRVGRTRRCRIDPRPLDEVSRLVDTYREFWSSRLDALSELLEPDADEAATPTPEPPGDPRAPTRPGNSDDHDEDPRAQEPAPPGKDRP